MQRNDDEQISAEEIVSMYRNVRLRCIQAFISILQTIVWWQVVDEISELLLSTLESSNLAFARVISGNDG